MYYFGEIRYSPGGLSVRDAETAKEHFSVRQRRFRGSHTHPTKAFFGIAWASRVETTQQQPAIVDSNPSATPFKSLLIPQFTQRAGGTWSERQVLLLEPHRLHGIDAIDTPRVGL